MYKVEELFIPVASLENTKHFHFNRACDDAFAKCLKYPNVEFYVYFLKGEYICTKDRPANTIKCNIYVNEKRVFHM